MSLQNVGVGEGVGVVFFSNRLLSFFYQSQNKVFSLTIPKWYNTWILKNIFEIFLEKIFLKYFFHKYFQNIFNTCSWNCETKCYHLALIEKLFNVI